MTRMGYMFEVRKEDTKAIRIMKRIILLPIVMVVWIVSFIGLWGICIPIGMLCLLFKGKEKRVGEVNE